MKKTLVIAKSEALARKSYNPSPEETVRYLAQQDYDLMSEDEKGEYVVMGASTESESVTKKSKK